MQTQIIDRLSNLQHSLAGIFALNHSRHHLTDDIRDHFRALLRNLRGVSAAGPQARQVVGVTSCNAGEGVTTIAVNLAAHAAADLGEQVLVIDASPGQQAVTRLLPSPPVIGLADLLRQRASLDQAIFPSRHANLHVLGLGAHPGEFSAAFDAPRMKSLLDLARQAFDFVIVDLPEANELSGCYPLAGLLDGVLLVLEAERVRNQIARHAKDQLVQAGAQLLGAVYNKRFEHVPNWLYNRV